MTTETRFQELADFLWSTADTLLRPSGVEQEHYGRVILPFTVLRRLDCVLEPTRTAVRTLHKKLQDSGVTNVERSLEKAAKVAFYNTSLYDFRRLIEDPDNCARNFTTWIAGFSPSVQSVLERFEFREVQKTVEEKKILYKLLRHFANVDLHPEPVPNAAMGSIFEELVRRFSDTIAENAGQYFTPREVVDLMADLVVRPDKKRLAQSGVARTIYDPCCGTGGMLFGAKRRIEQMNRNAEVHLYGQENADRIWAVCRADLMIASRDGRDAGNIAKGSTLSDDQHSDLRFDYLLANPPYGYHWEEFDGAKVREEFKKGHGRFVAGLPRKTDGQMLFLQHMIARMQRPEEGGARMAIVMGGSPLFAGDAGSGESEIRRWVFESDLCEAIIALPEQLFFNTPIGTYVWLLTNRKAKSRRNKVQLIDATNLWAPMDRSLGHKRRELAPSHIAEIELLYERMTNTERSRVLDVLDLGFRRLRIERPLRLRFEIADASLARLFVNPAWQKLTEKDEKLAQSVRRALEQLRDQTFMDRAAFRAALDDAAKDAQTAVTPGIRKVIEGALGDRDEYAEPCRDSKGNPEPDASLRNQNEETAPLTETDLATWFEREVHPHVPDAWLDTEVRERTYKWRDVADDAKNPERPGRVGYEVNFNRYFFKYTPPRALNAIDNELVAAEQAFLAALREVMEK